MLCEIILFCGRSEKQAYQIPKLELLADAETFYNLHSLCLDENDRVRSSKAPARVHACVCEFCCILLYFVASHGPQNGPQNGPKMVCDGPKMMQMTTARRGSLKTNTFARAFGTHTHRQCRSWPRAKTWTTLERARYAERFTKRRLTPRAGTRFATTAWWNTAGNFGSFIIIIIIIQQQQSAVGTNAVGPAVGEKKKRRRRRRRRLRRTRRKRRKRRKTK